jgi:PIN domain nuclease of toxin-antitoxin system
MRAPLLLDTCAAIWLAESEPISEEATGVLNDVVDTGIAVYVSPITAWEVGLLVARGRLMLLIRPEVWFQQLFEILNFRLAGMSPEVLMASSFLPGKPPRDPADRILAATAREFGYTIMTRDQPLLDYGDQGHVQVLAC